MDSYFFVKPFQDDCLHIGRFFALTIFNNKIYKRCLRFIFFYYLLIALLSIFYFVEIFNAVAIFRYLPVSLATLSALLINGCFWCAEKKFDYLEKSIISLSWSIDSTTKSTKQQILKEAKCVNLSIALNSLLGILAGLATIPSATDPDISFFFFFSRNYYLPCHKIFELLHLSTFPLSGYLMVNLANIVAYLCFHGKIQMKMGLDVLIHSSTEYSGYDENFLLNCEEYQQLIKKRIAFMVRRHNDLLQILQTVNDLTRLVSPYFALAFTLAIFSFLGYIFLLDTDYGLLMYFQHFLSIVCSCSTGMLLMFWGQQIENQTEALNDVMRNIFWLSFNSSNRKSILLMITPSQKCLQIKFTRSFSLNYNFGIRFVRNLYSFATVLARLKT